MLAANAHDHMNTATVTGHTALSYAARSGNVCAAAYLLEHKANVNQPLLATSGFTALHSAVLARKPDMIKLLVRAGACTHDLLSPSCPELGLIRFYTGAPTRLQRLCHKLRGRVPLPLNPLRANGGVLPSNHSELRGDDAMRFGGCAEQKEGVDKRASDGKVEALSMPVPKTLPLIWPKCDKCGLDASPEGVARVVKARQETERLQNIAENSKCSNPLCEVVPVAHALFLRLRVCGRCLNTSYCRCCHIIFCSKKLAFAQGQYCALATLISFTNCDCACSKDCQKQHWSNGHSGQCNCGTIYIRPSRTDHGICFCFVKGVIVHHRDNERAQAAAVTTTALATTSVAIS
jgi:hypothetical protein